MKLVIQFSTTLIYAWGAKFENKNPLKERSKHEYNSHTHPHKETQEPSLGCPMHTLSHPPPRVSPVAHTKSQIVSLIYMSQRPKYSTPSFTISAAS